MAYSIQKTTFAEILNGRCIVRADDKYFSVDRFGEEETLLTVDRHTAEKLRDAINAWLQQTR